MRLMLRQNLSDGKEYKYQIQFNSKDGYWYAWFYKEIDLKNTLSKDMSEKQNGNR